MKTKILTRLKPKAASLGFNEKELMGVAERISNNLNSPDATEEDIDASIDAVLPYLGIAQTVANRTIESARKKPIPQETEIVREDNNLSGSKTPPTTDEPEWFKNYRETQEKRIKAIENEKTITSRRSQLEAVVKDAGTLSAKTLKDFARMNFDTDEAFTEYLEDTRADVAAYQQERADKGLSDMGKPNSTGGVKTGDVDPILKERLKEREAETVTPAIAGLPQVK